jgi:uncharacterized membrane protein
MKIDRIAAWTLLITMLLFFVSGYGMTKGLINSQLAVNIHNNWLPIILISAFSFHTCYALSLALKRWKLWNTITRILLILVYILFFAFFVYINSFSSGFKKASSNTKSQTVIQESESEEDDTDEVIQNQNTSAAPSTKNSSYTLAQVSTHNTTTDCWIIISNVVYDISSYSHSGPQSHLFCGEDNTSALSQAHGLNYTSYFSKYKLGDLSN